MEREVGGGIGMGNTCKPMALSFQCMTKSTTKKKKNIMHLHMVKRLLFRQKLNPCEHTGFFFFLSVLKNILSQLIPCQWPLETPLVTFQERTD